MTNAATMRGIPIAVNDCDSALPILDSTNTLPNTPPAPVTKMMMATMGNAESAITLALGLVPLRLVSNQPIRN